MDPHGLRLNAAFAPQPIRFYVSHDGQTALGPFLLNEVKWMIRCRHFSRDVLIRGEHELSWVTYRNYVSRSVINRITRTVVTQLRRLRVLQTQQRCPAAVHAADTRSPRPL